MNMYSCLELLLFNSSMGVNYWPWVGNASLEAPHENSAIDQASTQAHFILRSQPKKRQRNTQFRCFNDHQRPTTIGLYISYYGLAH